MVFFVHAYRLSGASELSFFADLISSGLAVRCFFVVSGFLIFMSYENSSGISAYFEKRIRRIYPAYFVVVLLCALLGSLMSSYTIRDYFLSADLYRYLATNLVFLNFIQPTLPGVFAENPYTVVNGALWTLKIEVMFYLSVPLLVWFFRKVGLWQGLLLSYTLSLVYSFIVGHMAGQHGGIYIELQRQLPGQLMYFIAGAALYYYFDEFKSRLKILGVIAVVAFLLEYFLQLRILYAAALAILVIYLVFITKYMGNFGRFGDFSYGIYILHFPILQVLVAYGFFENAPLTAMVAATGLVLFAAFIMWHVIEKPMLKKSSHYLISNQ